MCTRVHIHIHAHMHARTYAHSRQCSPQCRRSRPSDLGNVPRLEVHASPITGCTGCIGARAHMCVRACVRACVRVYVHARLCACLHACARARLHACREAVTCCGSAWMAEHFGVARRVDFNSSSFTNFREHVALADAAAAHNGQPSPVHTRLHAHTNTCVYACPKQTNALMRHTRKLKGCSSG